MESFIEKQNFLKRWWLLVILISAVSFVPLLSAYSSGSIPVAAYITPLFAGGTVFLLFALLTLHTRIDELYVVVRFAPFHFKEKAISWADIKSATLVKYDPLFEYGGWGLRGRASKRAYNVSGKRGLQLVLTNGDQLLIGTDNHEQLKSYLEYIRVKYNITAIQ